MLEFSYRSQFFYGFFRREGRSDGSDGTVIEWDRDVDVVVAVCPPPPLWQRRVWKQ